MKSESKEIYVGSFMHNYQRLEYFYLKDTIGLRNVLENFYGTKYPNFKNYINLRVDADWKGYREFLYLRNLLSQQYKPQYFFHS